MARKNVSSGSPMEESIGFSRAVRIGNIISVSGTAAIAPDGSTAHPDDVYGQTKCCIEIMKRAIEKASGKLRDVTRTRVMLKDISKWKEAARAHGEYFSEIKPACTFVEVKGFVKEDWLVETEADCVIDTKS
jgi:enamine deaminase RidA (YjgF/YER057c/UK114 family)